VRQLLAESLVLSVAAGALGTLLAFWAASWFQARFRGPLAPLDVTPDATTLAFTLAVTLATGVLFGLVPALRAARPDIMPALAGDGAGVFRRSRLQGALVAVQVALSVALLFTGGLFVRKLQAMRNVDVGYDADRVVTVWFDLFTQRYGDEATATFYEELRARVARLPGVVSVSVPAYAPLGGGSLLEGVYPAPGEELAGPAGGFTAASVSTAPDYFRTLGIPLVSGRDFGPKDFAGGATGVVVSESFARRLSPGRDPIGMRFRLGRDGNMEVIGVARNIGATGLLEENLPLVYVPYTRHPTILGMGSTLLVRTAGDPAAVVPALRREVRELDATLPLFDVRTLADLVDRELGTQRRLTALVSSFGLLALLLAALGLYGVMAYTVAGWTREIGLRIALGALDRNVVGLFVRDGLRLTAIGLAAGVLLALALGRLVASVVRDVQPLDPAAALGVLATLSLAATLASYLPARRAARVDPMRALRVE